MGNPNIHVNAPVQVTEVLQTGAAVAESLFGPAHATQINDAAVNAAQQSSHFINFIL